MTEFKLFIYYMWELMLPFVMLAALPILVVWLFILALFNPDKARERQKHLAYRASRTYS